MIHFYCCYLIVIEKEEEEERSTSRAHFQANFSSFSFSIHRLLI